VKYLIRQGPKDLRLFLSLFTHSRFGKAMLPELYYLAGVPLTRLVGRDTRRLMSAYAASGEPFFINTFVSTTHPPFGSEWPYYTLFSDPRYAGESKFVMARLTDPWDIIRRQRDTKKDFDLDQIIDLYDGSVRNFDGEVKRIIDHLRKSGLADNTIVVVYSDHGMEFFEHDTWGQGNSVRGDASAKIPLLVVDPRRPGTGDCPRIVRSIDLAPTLLELLGLPVPDQMDGVSLKPYLDGSGVDMELPALNETGIWVTDVPGMPVNHLRYPDLFDLLEVPDKQTGTLAIKQEYQDVVVKAKDRMIRHGRWKLTYQPLRDGARYALFDVERDPDCLCDVAVEHPKVVADLEARLRRWLGSERSTLRFAPRTPDVLRA
jgi:arylsulfatase A-like enzyme